MPVTGIAFTMYAVSDMPRAVAFYRDVLGLTPGELVSDFWTEFDLNGATFGIGSFPQAGRPGSGASLALEVDDIAATGKRLAELEIAMTEPHELTNCWIAQVTDPDENVVWLHQRKRS
jgi:predicted enzyme related to lactoylglutathione lyase